MTRTLNDPSIYEDLHRHVCIYTCNSKASLALATHPLRFSVQHLLLNILSLLEYIRYITTKKEKVEPVWEWLVVVLLGDPDHNIGDGKATKSVKYTSISFKIRDFKTYTNSWQAYYYSDTENLLLLVSIQLLILST